MIINTRRLELLPGDLALPLLRAADGYNLLYYIIIHIICYTIMYYDL